LKRIGVVPYINALPLIYSLSGYDIIKATPSELSIQFGNKQLDIALLPVYELFNNVNVYIVDDISISSQDESGSVLLFLNKPIVEAKNIGLDQSSLSSTHLLKLLMKEYYRLDCIFKNISPNKLVQESKNYDAYLLIGDQAINHRKVNDLFIDLGTIWNEWTNLPFVFAVWVTKNKDEKLKNDLLKSKEEGLLNIKQIINNISYTDKHFLENYYSYYLKFNLGNKEKQAIQLFQKLLYKSKFISNKVELRYY